MKNKLYKSEIEQHLKGYTPEIFVFDRIDSTNSQAKRAVNDGMIEDGIFVAEVQTEGRGRRGKSFFSPRGTGLYFSAVLHPKVSLADATAITAAAAVVVTNVLKEETKKDPKIKWVNDIYIQDKKVCGILTEAVNDFESDMPKAIIVGIGINITTKEFPDEISNIAGATGEIDRNILTAKIFCGLKKLCDLLPNKDFMKQYKENSLVLGKEIAFSKNGTDYIGFAKDIDDNGKLEVITQNQEKFLLDSGEISIRLK